MKPGSLGADSLPPNYQALLEKAVAAIDNAYAPYSGVRIGAAIRTASGGSYSGANVENASYGLTICAERSAVFSAVAAEGPNMRLTALAVAADPSSISASPCGACRQVLLEFASDAEVIYQEPPGIRRVALNDLLPEAFRLRRP